MHEEEQDALVNSAEMEIRRISSPLPGVRKVWFRSRTTLKMLLLIMSLLNLSTLVGLTIALSIFFIQNNSFRDPEITISAAVLVNAGFSFYYIVRGVMRGKQYFICNYATGLFIMLIYCIIDMVYNDKSYQVLHMFRIGLLLGVSIPNTILCCNVCSMLSWTKFAIVGASETIQAMYGQLCYFSSLLTFDLQISLTFIILRLNHGIKMSTCAIVILAAGIPLCAVFNIIGYIAVQWELKRMVWFFVVLCLIQPAYIIYDIVMIYLTFDESSLHPLIMYSVLVAGAISILIRIIMLHELRPVYNHFGYGLQDKAFAGLIACEKTSLLSPPSR